MPLNQGPIAPQQWVAYLDLSGGRNTKKDPHALDRNQLVVSDNTWEAQGNTIGKRPGSISFPGISAGHFAGGGISAGATGLGVSLHGMVTGRFSNITTLVVQGSNNHIASAATLPGISTGVNSWISIGVVSGGRIAAAQLFDPDPNNKNGPDGTLFIVTGKDVPLAMEGANRPLIPLTYIEPGYLPTKSDGSGNPITPAYIATLFDSLFYAGEPTDPSMLYISNPFLPEQFTENLVVPTASITGSSYIGLPVGRGDGIGGGVITALAPMGSAMIGYKQSAIYAITQLSITGDSVWGSSIQSSSVGCIAPRSLVAFDTFHCFLGIDGVYTFSLGTSLTATATTKISTNNPDLFDGGFSPVPLIQNRTSAIGVRYGNRYIIFFDDGGGTTTALGYNNRAAWFDFDKLDADGLPACGTMSGFNVGGVGPLRGPSDAGNFAWADALQDRVGMFNGPANALPVYSDFGVPITTTVTGKADYFADVWGQEAPVMLKTLDSVYLLMAFPIVTTSQEYQFNGMVLYDQLSSLSSVGTINELFSPSQAIVGSAIVGTAVLGVQGGETAYSYTSLFQQAGSQGTIVQVSFTESSIYPWTCLGYLLLINAQEKVGITSA